MIRFFIGFLLMFGLAGGIENCPPDPSINYILASLTVFVVATALMLSGVKSIKETA